MPESTRILGNHDREITNLARIGSICAVEGKLARVSIGPLVTDLIPWTSRRAAEDYDYWQPSIGEQVVVLSLWGDPSQGVIIGMLAQDKYQPPTDGPRWGKRFRDGTVLTYDPDSHVLNIQAVNSPVTIKAKSATLDIPNIHCTGNITTDGDVIASGISLKSHKHSGVKPGDGSTGSPA